MLSIKQCRKYLAPGLSDKQVIGIRNDLYKIANESLNHYVDSIIHPK